MIFDYFSCPEQIIEMIQNDDQEDLEFYLRNARSCRNPVLIIPSGTGRIAVALASEGMKVIGVEENKTLIEIARKRMLYAGKLKGNIMLLRSGSNELSVNESFGMAVYPNFSFQNLFTVEQQVEVLTRIFDRLKNNARLIINIEFADINNFISARKSNKQVIKRNIKINYQKFRVIMEESRNYSYFDQMVDKKYDFEIIDEEENTTEYKSFGFRQRFFHRFEFQNLLERCGYTIENLFGDFKENDFNQVCSEMIWIAKK